MKKDSGSIPPGNNDSTKGGKEAKWYMKKSVALKLQSEPHVFEKADGKFCCLPLLIPCCDNYNVFDYAPDKELTVQERTTYMKITNNPSIDDFELGVFSLYDISADLHSNTRRIR